MTRLLALYLTKRIVRGLLIAAAIIFSLIALVDFVEATRDAGGEGNLSNLDLFGLTLLKTPSLIEQTLPFIMLFATIGTLNALNRRSELIAARAAGVSAWRYLRPALGLAVVFALFWMLIGNPLSGQALRWQDQIRQDAQVEDTVNAERIWLREATETRRMVMLAESFDAQTRTLNDVMLLTFDRQAERDVFERRIDAERAEWLPTGYFQLSGVREWEDEAYLEGVETLSLPTTLTEQDLLERVEQDRSTRLPAFWKLPALIRAQKKVGFSTLLPRMKFWKLTALPVLLVAMTLIGACVSMRLSREGGTWRLILTGAAIGFAVFFASVFVEAFGEVGTLPPLIAAWTVPLLTLVLGIAYLAKLEDG
jgi:lipopolysaccharide export system permease protein